MKDDKYLELLNHSCAHLLAKAVLTLWPGSHNAIGPAIENGFYQDFDMGEVKITDSDFPKIEEEMRKILETWDHFDYREVTLEEAKKLFKHNPYKVELATEFAGEGKKLTVNDPGDFLDLCKMTHIDNPSKEMAHFKLLSVAGAYWRGSEKNKMLTRIYGTIFPTKDQLDAHLVMLSESEKRNHKKIGRELGLFMFHETAPGMAYWLPKGVKLYLQLVDFWRKEHERYNYQEIFSPLINKKELYETSGHWDHFKENMFISETEEGEIYGLKPMNCPNAMVVFRSETRSYRDLPLKLSDTDTLHRFERSGTLNGLLRIREFRQDDAHIFVEEAQIKDQFNELFEITDKFYSVFGIKYSFRLGTRPEKFMGDPKLWTKAEKELKEILDNSKKEYTVLEGDGAFYGPKIDILMKDSLGRDWQMGTLQLDFQIPSRFGLKYAAEDGTQKTPVVIHRVIYGSLERFIGIITEHFVGAFPTWINPVQVKILPITERNMPYAQSIMERLKENNIRTELDARNETLGGKIRDAQLEKVSYMIVVGDRDEKEGKISIRKRNGVDLGSKELEYFMKDIKKEIDSKSLN